MAFPSRLVEELEDLSFMPARLLSRPYLFHVPDTIPDAEPVRCPERSGGQEGVAIRINLTPSDLSTFEGGSCECGGAGAPSGWNVEFVPVGLKSPEVPRIVDFRGDPEPPGLVPGGSKVGPDHPVP